MDRPAPDATVTHILDVAPAAGPRRRTAAWLLDGRGWPWLACALDLVALLGAVGVALALTGGERDPGGLAPLLAFPAVGVVALGVARERARRLDAGALDDAWALVASISLAGMLTAVMQQLAAGGSDAAAPVAAWAAALVLVGTTHIAVRTARRCARVRRVAERATLIVGAGEVGARIARRLADHPQYGLRPVGFLDDTAPPAELVGGRPAPVLGGPGDLADVIRDTHAQQVVLAFSAEPDRSLVPLVRTCEAMHVGVSLVPRLFESTNDRMTYEQVGGVPLLSLHSTDVNGRRIAVKHALDRVVAVLLLLAAAPLLAVIAVAIALTSPGPVLFRQRRTGRGGREFDLLKFRTMTVLSAGERVRLALGADRAPGGVEGADRRTPIGRLLRRTSLDELPQLINVLRGEMSLVGPRPERLEFVALFSQTLERYADRHRMRPGITGAAQVKGLRGQTSLVERVELDNLYIEHWSFVMDAKIVLRTALAAFRVPE